MTTVNKDIPHESTNQEIIILKNSGPNLAQNVIGAIEQPPCPLSALLYQTLMNDSLTPDHFVRLLRKSVSDLNSSKISTSCSFRTVLVWHLEKSEDNRNIFQSPSSTSLKLFERHLKQPEQELLQMDLPALPETNPSPTLFRRGSYLPVQKSFDVPSDDEHQSLDEVHTPSEVFTLGCPNLTLTVEGVSKAMPLETERTKQGNNSDCNVKKVLTCSVVENLLNPAGSHVVETTQIKEGPQRKLNLPPQFYSNEDNQAVPSTTKIQVESHNFLIPDEKIVYDKALSDDIIRTKNVTEQSRILTSEQKSENVYSQDTICDPASGSRSFLELKPLKTLSQVMLSSRVNAHKFVESFHHDLENAMDQPEILTSCAFTETMQELLEQLHKEHVTLSDGESIPPSLAFSRSSIMDIDFNPVRRGSRPSPTQFPLGTSLLTLSPTEKTRDKSPSEGRNAGIKEVVFFRTTSDRLGHCKLGSWWKQGLETRRASTGLLPAIEHVSPVTKGSLAPEQPQSHRPIRGSKQDVKQAREEVSQSRRAKGKRGKRTKWT